MERTSNTSSRWIARMLNISLSSANAIYTLSGVMLVLGALFTVVGTFAGIWSGGVRERYGDERIARNEAETAAAKAQAASANAEAAKANLEQQRLKERLAWRTLSQDQYAALVNVLGTQPSVVTLAYPTGDPEALAYAIQFSRIFEVARWNMRAQSKTLSDRVHFDIIILGPNDGHVNIVRQAFTAAGIQFNTGDVPRSAMDVNHEPPDLVGIPSTVTVFIGSKRPAFFAN